MTVAGSAAAQYAPPPPPPAPAAPPGYYPPPMPQRQHFGDASQLVISNDTNFGLSGSSFSNNGGSTFTLTIQPAIDWFIIQNLSIGALVTFDHASANVQGSSTSSNSYGVGGRVGYNIAIGDALSWWPKLALLYAGSSGSTTPPGAGAQTTTSGNAFDVQVFAPFLLHPINHFFLGIGPFVQTDLTASQSKDGQSVQNPTKQTSYGALFDMGGWMDF
jgi:hypothetical protein